MNTSIEVVFRPNGLGYKEFHKLDRACFPEEPPVDRDVFLKALVGEFWGAYDDDRFVGFGYLREGTRPAWIARLAVAQDARRQGIGGRLIETMLEHCRSKGEKSVILYVKRDNETAVRLYIKHGFEVVEPWFQYVVPAAWFAEYAGSDGRPVHGEPVVRAVPIDSVKPADRPRFPDQWSDLPERHDPPNRYVFLFMDQNGATVGYCGLSPGFPGCLPFEVESPGRMLPGALASLRPYLLPEKDILRLTFGSAMLAAMCDNLGFTRNYMLYKMGRPF
jgi:GNAT superfamily N-acetyltransferase